MIETIKRKLHWLVHEGSHYAHLAYFGGVYIEGHGFYAIMGGILLSMGTIALFIGEEEV